MNNRHLTPVSRKFPWMNYGQWKLQYMTQNVSLIETSSVVRKINRYWSWLEIVQHCKLRWNQYIDLVYAHIYNTLLMLMSYIRLYQCLLLKTLPTRVFKQNLIDIFALIKAVMQQCYTWHVIWYQLKFNIDKIIQVWVGFQMHGWDSITTCRTDGKCFYTNT